LKPGLSGQKRAPAIGTNDWAPLQHLRNLATSTTAKGKTMFLNITTQQIKMVSGKTRHKFVVTTANGNRLAVSVNHFASARGAKEAAKREFKL
jgi:predicted glycosyltransferase involved in capsule biosynthesis